METILSMDNKFFKKIKKLKSRKYREKENLFLAEGHKFLDFRNVPFCIIVKEGEESYKDKLEKFQCSKYMFSNSLFNEVSSQENSQGIIVVYKIEDSQPLESLKDNIVVLDRVQDPGNLGTIIRLTDAAGFKNIVLTKGSADIYNEKTVRSSMGSLFNINFNWVDESELIDFLKDNGYNVIVTALREDAIPYTKMSLNKKNAFIFGNEGQGISENIIKNSNSKVIIPIYGSAESLNVAVASGIILYKCRELLT